MCVTCLLTHFPSTNCRGIWDPHNVSKQSQAPNLNTPAEPPHRRQAPSEGAFGGAFGGKPGGAFRGSLGGLLKGGDLQMGTPISAPAAPELVRPQAPPLAGKVVLPCSFPLCQLKGTLSSGSGFPTLLPPIPAYLRFLFLGATPPVTRKPLGDTWRGRGRTASEVPRCAARARPAGGAEAARVCTATGSPAAGPPVPWPCTHVFSGAHVLPRPGRARPKGPSAAG